LPQRITFGEEGKKMEREFDREKDCFKCHREIDEIEVRLKKIIVGPDTYRRYGKDEIETLRYEKYCTDCLR
jgi:hypothetical protein